jgi:hypothetical protein
MLQEAIDASLIDEPVAELVDETSNDAASLPSKPVSAHSCDLMMAIYSQHCYFILFFT